MPTATATLVTTTTATSTLRMTSIPMFLPDEVPVTTQMVNLPGGFALGKTSSAQINFVASVVAGDGSAITYQLDCETAKDFALFKPSSVFSCPYNGAMVTSGPNTYVWGLSHLNGLRLQADIYVDYRHTCIQRQTWESHARQWLVTHQPTVPLAALASQQQAVHST